MKLFILLLIISPLTWAQDIVIAQWDKDGFPEPSGSPEVGQTVTPCNGALNGSGLFYNFSTAGGFLQTSPCIRVTINFSEPYHLRQITSLFRRAPDIISSVNRGGPKAWGLNYSIDGGPLTSPCVADPAFDTNDESSLFCEFNNGLLITANTSLVVQYHFYDAISTSQDYGWIDLANSLATDISFQLIGQSVTAPPEPSVNVPLPAWTAFLLLPLLGAITSIRKAKRRVI